MKRHKFALDTALRCIISRSLMFYLAAVVFAHFAASAADIRRPPDAPEKAANSNDKTPPAAAEKENVPQKDAPDQAKKSIGRLIRVQLPIDGQTLARVKRFVTRAMEQATAENATPVLIFEFDVPKGQENFGRGSDFFSASSLASYLTSDELNGATDGCLYSAVDPGSRRFGGHGLPANRDGPRRDYWRGGCGRKDNFARVCRLVQNHRQPPPHRARGHRPGHVEPGGRTVPRRYRGSQGNLRRSRRIGGTQKPQSGGKSESRQAGGRNGAVYRQRSAADELRGLFGVRPPRVDHGARVCR